MTSLKNCLIVQENRVFTGRKEKCLSPLCRNKLNKEIELGNYFVCLGFC